MGRPRKPTNILNLTGAFDKNPARRKARANEPKDLGELGDPPQRLNAEQLKAWNEIVENAAYGVLTKSDRHSLEITAVLLAEFWETGALMTGTHLNILNTSLGKMGLNPSDRSRVTVQQQKEENPFAKFDD